MRVAPPTITTPLTSADRQAGVAQRLFDRLNGLGNQRLADLGEDLGGQLQLNPLAAGQARADRRNAV
jgi:hypothetical protein